MRVGIVQVVIDGLQLALQAGGVDLPCKFVDAMSDLVGLHARDLNGRKVPVVGYEVVSSGSSGVGQAFESACVAANRLRRNALR